MTLTSNVKPSRSVAYKLTKNAMHANKATAYKLTGDEIMQTTR